MKMTHTYRLSIAALSGLALAGPIMAGVTIDQQPLVLVRPLPPNIMFIMDDSGSMAWQHMPGTNASWSSAPTNGLPNDISNNDLRLRTSTINTQWYDPAKTYLPWKNWDGSAWTAYDPKTQSLPYDPSGEVVSTYYTYNPRQGSFPSAPSTTNRDHSSTTASTGYYPNSNSALAYRFQGFYRYSGSGSGNQANSYQRFDFRWNNGQWEARLCSSTSWNCTANYVGNTAMGPYGRTLEDEIQNYANWFSYHRLRASMAKAAASQIFAELGEDYRVGYDTIWNRQSLNIPVGNDNGLFRDTNKQNWFNRLFNTGANDGTPLRQALGRAGEYFRQTGSSGPYGPESGSDQFSCRQNFAILTTDGYWNSNQADSSGARSNNDGNNGSTITGPNGASYRYLAEWPYEDSRSGTLADVAMYYWKNDLRAGASGLKNDVPTSAGNPAFWQHMTTFGISIGLEGSLPTDTLPASWTNPTDDEDDHRIDDLWHAAVNSRGKFIVASDADTFSESLTSSLGEIGSRLGSGASLAANSTKLEQSTRTFQAQYWSAIWAGEMNAFQVDPNTGELGQTPLWKASENMPAHASRNIWMHNPQGTGSNKFRQFSWSNLNGTQQSALGSSSVVEYLRGNRSLELSQGGAYRDRSSALGDIVNSQPVFVGAPNASLYASSSFSGGGATYTSYASAWASRAPRIYVGANDGMLHAFNATTGAETYAFVPNTAIVNDMASLSSPHYEHKYFVDGEITVADVYGGSPAAWRTVLVGTMGRGARAMFALDVTDPSSPSLLWEISSADSAALNTAMGNMLGKPIIAQIADGNWKVLIGNGANSGSDTAQLLTVDVFSGSVSSIGTGASGNNGLTAIYTFDSDRDGFVDMAFGGDYLGNIWRFNDLAGTPSVQRLFRATDPSTAAQPITAAPIAAVDPATGLRWVFFGTGKYLSEADLNDDQVQTWYGIIDRGAEVTKATLVQRSITAEGEINGFGARVIGGGGPEDLVGMNGWYMNLVSPVNGAEGERMVVPNQLLGQVLVGTTRIPDASDPCVPSGRGFVMAIDPFTGARLPQTFFDITRDGDFTDADKLNGQIVSGVGFYSSPNNPIFIENVMQVSLDDGTTRTMATQGTAATAIRQSWRELLGQ